MGTTQDLIVAKPDYVGGYKFHHMDESPDNNALKTPLTQIAIGFDGCVRVLLAFVLFLHRGFCTALAPRGVPRNVCKCIGDSPLPAVRVQACRARKSTPALTSDNKVSDSAR